MNDFLLRMKSLLGDEFDEFLKFYNSDDFIKGLRVNTLKCSPEKLCSLLDFELKKTPFCDEGFYIPSDVKSIGNNPLHHAGAFYVQEPSATSAVTMLDVHEGDYVLDLCAAPGGKSTQIGAKLNGTGLLWSNEIVRNRANILLSNIERMGISNAVVSNCRPDELCKRLENRFDRILVDAPCSGEGMFRKNEDACDEWSPENVENCAARQAEILDCAAEMLQPGGRLVYSTCTFAPAENEGSISRFLERHPEFELLPAEKKDGMMPGVPAWTEHPAEGLEHTIRLWPHHLKGEGHYLAVLQKAGVLSKTCQGYCRNGVEKGINEKECREFFAFAEENLVKNITGSFLKFGDQLYRMPEGMPSIRNLKVLRPGLHLGTLKKNRFEPSHALALALRPDQVKHVCNLESDDPQVKAYLNGQTLNMDGEKGWYLVAVDGYSIGWGKLAGGILKNHYPKGLRKNG